MVDVALDEVCRLGDVQITRVRQTQAVIERFKNIALEAEPVLAARHDAATFWIPQIQKALEKGESTVTNWRWMRNNGRSDLNYVLTLEKILGPPFRVSWFENILSLRWTEVSW